MTRIHELVVEHERLARKREDILRSWVDESGDGLGPVLVFAAYEQLAIRNELIDALKETA